MEWPSVNLELILGVVGTITGILSLLISMYYTRRAIGQADKALEQADRNFKTELLYEDRKRALMTLQKILNDSKYGELSKNFINFSISFEGNYIPKEVFKNINEKIQKLEAFYDDNSPYPSDEELYGEYVDDREPQFQDQYEKFDSVFAEKINFFKDSAKNDIYKGLKEI